MHRDAGARISEIARELNEAGHTTSLGNRFYPSTVAKLVGRVAALTAQKGAPSCGGSEAEELRSVKLALRLDFTSSVHDRRT